jgi:hypothetical protein
MIKAAAMGVILFGFLLFFSAAAPGQTWTQTQANINYYWYGVAASADGTKLAATVSSNPGEGIYLSTNSGMTWNQSQAPAGEWGPIASSADGTQLVAGNANGYIYISTNSGASWNKTSSPAETWSLIASSADGTKLLAVFPPYESGSTGPIMVSTNSGNSWLPATNLFRYWRAITCSADGSKMAAQPYGDGTVPYVSTNYGQTWKPAASLINQSGALAATADGSKLMLAGSANFFLSTNWGTTWSSTNQAPVYGYTPMVGSANGSSLLSCSGNGNEYAIYTSTNFGLNWTSNNVAPEDWVAFAASADGDTLVAVATKADVTGGGIWVSQTVPSPQLNLSSGGNNLAVSWIVPSTNMVLEQSPDLVNWVPLTNQPAINDANLQEQLTLSPTNSVDFFRLISQ